MSLRGIGLDIGATKTLGVLADHDGTVLAEAHASTTTGPAGVLSTAVEVVRELRVDGQELWPIGIGVPGLVDAEAGSVRHAVNLDLDGGWLPLGRELEQLLGHKVVVENDVNAAALGAAALLPAGVPRDLAYLSIGTGLAAGIVLDGRLRRGVHGAAGEIGHIPVDPAGPLCACGQRGCLELTVSGAALSASYGGSAQDLFRDPGAEEVRTRFVTGIAAAVRLVCLTVDVEVVVLGGGVAQVGEPLRAAVAAVLDEQAAGSEFLASLRLSERLSVVPDQHRVAAVGAALLGRPSAAG